MVHSVSSNKTLEELRTSYRRGLMRIGRGFLRRYIRHATLHIAKYCLPKTKQLKPQPTKIINAK